MPHLAKAAEITAIASSTIGAIASIVTQQVGYAIAPMSMAVFLSSLNRHRLEQELHQEQTIKFEKIDALVSAFSEEVERKVDAVIEDKLTSFNHFEFAESLACDLILGRKESREMLIKSLQSAEDNLVLVCPWLTKSAIDSKLLHYLQSALSRGVIVEIGWGRLPDLQSGDYQRSNYYNALPLLEQLKRQHQNLTLKPIGTHEKFLVCDRKFAVIGTHNFLTSNDVSQEREVSLRTTDQNVIHQLLMSFQAAPAIALSKPVHKAERISKFKQSA